MVVGYLLIHGHQCYQLSTWKAYWYAFPNIYWRTLVKHTNCNILLLSVTVNHKYLYMNHSCYLPPYLCVCFLKSGATGPLRDNGWILVLLLLLLLLSWRHFSRDWKVPRLFYWRQLPTPGGCRETSKRDAILMHNSVLISMFTCKPGENKEALNQV